MTSKSDEIYSEKQIAELSSERKNLFKRVRPLYERYCGRIYASDKAHEFATQGFARRLEIIAMCVQNVFELISVEKKKNDIPDTAALLDTAINIQTSIINTFGAIDNLAWVWVEERKVVGNDGEALDKFAIGLGSKCRCVRRSFPKELQDHLKTLDEWFDGIGDFRDGLAHRIPLYIPPSCVLESTLSAHDEIFTKREEAHKRKEFAEYERLDIELKKFYVFQPYFKGSFVEKSLTIAFHFQLLNNLNTLLGLGEKIMEELDRPVKTSTA